MTPERIQAVLLLAIRDMLSMPMSTRRAIYILCRRLQLIGMEARELLDECKRAYPKWASMINDEYEKSEQWSDHHPAIR